MKHFKGLFAVSIAAIAVLVSCNNDNNKKDVMKESMLKEESVTYTGDSVTMKGFVVYDDNFQEKRPAVLVIHEWWGQTDYVRMRARELAKLGYIAMAVDFYGDGKTADNPDSAGKLSMPFYSNPKMVQARFNAAWEKLKSFKQTDPDKVAAIGYCFGGAQALTLAKMGEPLSGVVSFHGNLNIVPASKDLLKAPILVCHGAIDPFVPGEEVEAFKKQMDSIGAKYTFKAYEGAVHAFTNPEATAMGEKFKIPIKYNAAADTASWNDMKVFFKEIFN